MDKIASLETAVRQKEVSVIPVFFVPCNVGLIRVAWSLQMDLDKALRNLEEQRKIAEEKDEHIFSLERRLENVEKGYTEMLEAVKQMQEQKQLKDAMIDELKKLVVKKEQEIDRVTEQKAEEMKEITAKMHSIESELSLSAVSVSLCLHCQL
jgi:DNA repair exonuclease SbcCD ATPase subunit